MTTKEKEFIIRKEAANFLQGVLEREAKRKAAQSPKKNIVRYLNGESRYHPGEPCSYMIATAISDDGAVVEMYAESLYKDSKCEDCREKVVYIVLKAEIVRQAIDCMVDPRSLCFHRDGIPEWDEAIRKAVEADSIPDSAFPYGCSCLVLLDEKLDWGERIRRWKIRRASEANVRNGRCI